MIESSNQAPEILIPKKNIILDASTFSTLMSCARLTDFRFNHSFVSIRGKSSSLIKGSIVHAVLENFYKSIIGGMSRSQAVGFGLAAGQAYASSDDARNVNSEDVELALKTSEEYLDFYKNDFWIPLEVECVKGAVIYEDDEIRILWKAKYDWIVDTTQLITSVDHKTMSQRRDTLTLNNQFMGQCVLLGVRSMFVNKIGFQKSLKPEEKFTRLMINYTNDQLVEWQSTIVPYYAKLMLMYQESEYWPPNFTHCENKYGFCTFKDVCSSDRNMREETLKQFFEVGKKWDVTNDEKE
jgi:hypothetical protein